MSGQASLRPQGRLGSHGSRVRGMGGWFPSALGPPLPVLLGLHYSGVCVPSLIQKTLTKQLFCASLCARRRLPLSAPRLIVEHEDSHSMPVTGAGAAGWRVLGRGTGSAQSTGEGLLPALALSLPPKDRTGGAAAEPGRVWALIPKVVEPGLL